MTADAVSEPRLQRSLQLAALPNAVTVTRFFVLSTLRRWQAGFVEDNMLIVAVELVRHSLEKTGPGATRGIPSNLIVVNLLGYPTSVAIEVRDRYPEPASAGDGLQLVRRLAGRWGSYVTDHDRVTWAELSIVPPRRRVVLSPSIPEGLAPLNTSVLRRVRDALDDL